MIQVGAHRFSETDARRTVQLAPLLADLMADGRDPTLLAPNRAALKA